MRAASTLLAVFVAVTVTAALPRALAAGAEQGEHSVLVGVPALEKKLSYSETKISLGDLVRKVAADTGALLSASPEVADEPVAVVVKEMPARELLEELAQLLDYQWHQEGSQSKRRWIIYQDIAAKQAEEGLRGARRQEVEQRFQNDLRRLVEMSALSQNQLEQILSEHERHWQELQARKLSPEERQALYASPEEHERFERNSDAIQLWSPVSREAAHLLGRLSAEHWAMLRHEGELILSTNSQPGELALPEEVARRLRAAQPRTDLPTFRPASLEEDQNRRAYEQRRQEEWSAATGYRVVIQFDAGQLERRDQLGLRADVLAIRSGDPNSLRRYSHSSDNSVTIFSGPNASSDAAADQTPQRRAALASDPVVGARKLFRRDDAQRPEHFGREKGPARFQELLPDIARIYGVQVISDAYWSDTPTQSPVAGTEPIPLFELLDMRAGLRQHWDHHGNLVRLRSRMWFLDRPRELPLRLVRRWKQMGETLGALPLDQYLEIGRSLTDPQLECLFDLVGQEVFPEELDVLRDLPDMRSALRLLASLSPEQRRVVDNGGSLPLQALTAPQRLLFLAAMKEHGRYGPPPMPVLDCGDGRLTLTADRTARTVTVVDDPGGGRSVTYHQGNDTVAVIPPGHTLEDLRPAARGSAAGPSLAPTLQPTRGGTPLAGSRPNARPRVWERSSRHAVTGLTVRFVCGPASTRQAYLIVASEREPPLQPESAR